ncbi:PDZ domain-containing protein [Tenacibaculum sp. SG-28]|uniref:PDZ domain-containing protein n=1 Tax=Tenacibaculum sp. SG-28 TaxID=754426 RepID=UPI000CF43F8F|nr:PDZ domain-containing protein [Tenacibaculum sp. SG-28]
MKLQKNRNFNDGFFYNMSGIQVIYGKLDLVAQKKLSTVNSYGIKEYNSPNTGKIIDFVSNYVYNFKPSFKIDKIVKDSPAAKAGLLEGDIIYYLNGKPFYELNLSDFSEIFRSKPNRKIKLSIKRAGQDLKYSFRLEKGFNYITKFSFYLTISLYVF